MMKTNLLGALSAASLVILFSCNQGSPVKDGQGTDILATNMDTTVNPADDFFEYANGGWIKKNPIPGAYGSWGIGNLVQEELYSRLRTINEKAAEGSDATSRKIADFWKSGMDSVTINKAGITPIYVQLRQIDNISSTAQLISTAAVLNHYTGVMMSIFVDQDSKNSEAMALHLYQGGLGLPNRDYYFNTDARTTSVRLAYPAHIARMLQFTGLDSNLAKTAAADVVKLETRLAKASRTLEAMRNAKANYNKMSVNDLGKIAGNIDWPMVLQQLEVKQDTVIVGQPEFYKELSNAVTSESLSTWKNYLKYHLITAAASYLSDSIANTDFNFYGKTLRGLESRKPRWKEVLAAEEEAIGEALGQLFVKEYFNEQAKKRYEDMVEHIRESLRVRIEKLDWMSDSTKQRALEKLAKIKKKVGYPDKWKDFSAMDIKAQSYFENMMAARKWWYYYELAKLGKPVDRTEWHITPQTYNAYYNSSNNEIVLPAGIFTVPGKRDEELDDALVYGYAGASTIGHEITHGFDDEGRQFDAQGNLKSWWTQGDEAKFNQRAEVMVQQFNGYVPVDSMHLNGKATLGENIADLGGVLLGWDAFVKTKQYKEGKPIAGLRPDQRYFLGYSLGWLNHSRKEELTRRVLTDVHSPAKYRVNGPFADVDAFYKAFNVQPGNGMYRPDSLRVRIW